VSPAHLGIKQIFWLIPHFEDVDDSKTEVTFPDPPYYKATLKFQQLPEFTTPIQKTNCLVQTAKAIIQCITDYWEGKMAKEKLIVAADELVPIYSFLVCKANIANLVAECNFMEFFIGGDMAMKQNGYLVATLQTCMAYLSTLGGEQMEKSAQEVLESLRGIEKKIENNKPEIKGSNNNNNNNAPIAEMSLERLEEMLSFVDPNQPINEDLIVFD